MKPRFTTARGAIAISIVLACAPMFNQTAQAQTNGTWSLNGSGNWSNAENWTGGNVASGATATANFSTLNITANQTVTIDAPFTIGTLTAQDATTASHDWIFAGTDRLTLRNGLDQPLINISNRTTTISAPLAGTNGIRKTGAGLLVLSGNNSALSGTLLLDDVTGTNTAGVAMEGSDALGNIDQIIINGTSGSGAYLELRNGATLPGTTALTLNSPGGNNAPAGGIRTAGTGVATINSPIAVTLNQARISNNSATRLVINGAITGGANNIMFRFANNEGIHLTNTGNSWTGTTIHSAGTLTFEPGALPPANIGLAQSEPGTIQTHGSFTRGLGTGTNEIAFGNAAGRAQGLGARGGDLTVNFGGAGATVLFDTAGTPPASRIRTNTLVLNGANADSKITLVNPLDLNGGSRTIQVSANVAELTGGIIGGAFDLTKTSTGTLRLNAPVTHAGNTILNGGTLQLAGADNRLPVTSTLAFTGTSTLDLTTTSQTLAAITTPDLVNVSLAVQGSGTLALNGTSNFQAGPGGAVTSAHSVALDLSGLSSFTYTAPANVFRVGLKTGSSNASGGGAPGPSVLFLAAQNTITAATLALADVSANNNGGTTTLHLGGTNLLKVGSINSGASGRSNSNILFDPLRVNPTLTIRNTDGTSAVNDWRVGQVANFGASTWTDTVNLSGGSSDILVNTLTIGTADIGGQTGRGGTENASFTMGQGSLQATTVNVGRISGTDVSTITSTMAANGTFTLNHPDGLLKAGTITLATNTMLGGGTGARSVSGTLNLTHGTIEATSIQRGPQTGNATVTANFNWTDGTLRNTPGADLLVNNLPVNLIPGNHTFDVTGTNSITLNATSPVNGTGGFVKTGTGTLVLDALGSFSGTAEVQQGTLAINNTLPANTDFLVDASATLSLANLALHGNQLTGKALDIDGNLIIAGPVHVILPGDPVGTTQILGHGSVTGAGNLTANYRNFSFTSGASSTSLTVGAGLPLTWTGQNGDTWDHNSTVNWKDGGNNPQTFFWWDAVNFDESGAQAEPVVNLTGELRPAAIHVNSTTDYTFTGTGTLAGPFALTKNGPGTLTLGGGHSFDGGISILGGTLKPVNSTSLGAIGQVITIASGASLDTNGSNTANRDYEAIISGTGVDGNGAIVNTGAGSNNGFSSLTLTGNAAIGGTARWDVRPISAGASVIDLDGKTLTKTGDNVIAFADGSMTSGGTVRIDQGSLFLSRMIVTGSGSVDINSGATLRLENYSTGFVDKPIHITDGTLELTGNANFTLDSTVNITGTGTIGASTGRVLTLYGAIGGNGSLNKIDPGTVYILENSTYSGTTTVSGGTLQFGNFSPDGSPGPGDIINNSTLRFNRGVSSTVPNVISGSGNLILGANAALTQAEWDIVTTLTGENTFAGGITIFSGGLRILNAAALGTGPKTISMNYGSNGRPQFYLDGSGGNIAVPADISFVTSTNQIAHPAIGNLAGDNSINGNITLQSGGGDTLVTVAGGSLALNGQIAAGTSLRNLRLHGALGANGTVNGRITNGSNPLGVIVQGSNIWTFTNSLNDYTGTTTVNSGTLLVNGNQSAANGAVTVHAGGTLGGTGTLGGGTSANAGSTIAPGISIGTLSTTAPVNLAGTLAIELDAGSSDRLAVGGALDLDETSSSLVISQLATPSQPVYIIASYTGLSGTFASVTGLPAGYSLDYNYNNLNQIALVSGVSSPFGTWINSFSSLTNPDDKLPEADPDGDGANNLLEFALNGDPADGSNNGLMASLVQDATAPAGNELTLIIAARRGAVFGTGPNGVSSATIHGVKYTIEGTVNLAFPGSPVTHAGTADTAPAATGLPSLAGKDWEYHTFSLDASEGLPAKGFLRLLVEQE